MIIIIIIIITSLDYYFRLHTFNSVASGEVPASYSSHSTSRWSPVFLPSIEVIFCMAVLSIASLSSCLGVGVGISGFEGTPETKRYRIPIAVRRRGS